VSDQAKTYKVWSDDAGEMVGEFEAYSVEYALRAAYEADSGDYSGNAAKFRVCVVGRDDWHSYTMRPEMVPEWNIKGGASCDAPESDEEDDGA
jgi:hypothetical protein